MNWRQKVNRRLVVVPIAEADEKRQVIAYPDLGWSVEHRRVETHRRRHRAAVDARCTGTGERLTRAAMSAMIRPCALS